MPDEVRKAETPSQRKLDPEKENRLPPRMAARYNNMAKEPTPRAGQGTPGRRVRPGNQYFEVGKVGRKTGITLQDTGIRDDYGLEPVSGIFSSPGSVQRPTYIDDGSAEMEGLDSEIPDLDQTLRSRQTPHLLPPRASTPRKSNITGSPRRQSSVKSQRNGTYASSPRASTGLNIRRALDFDNKNVRQSIEARSPFRPKNNLRRSDVVEQHIRPRGVSQQSGSVAPPTLMIDTPESSKSIRRISAQPSRHPTDEPRDYDFDDDDENEPFQDDGIDFATGEDIEGALGLADSFLQQSPQITPRTRVSNGKRSSRLAITNNDLPEASPSSGRKRPRLSIEDGSRLDQPSRDQPSQVSPSPPKRPTHITFADPPPQTFDDDDYDQQDNYDEQPADEEAESGEQEPQPSTVRPRQPKAQARPKKGVAQPRQKSTSARPRQTREDSLSSDDSDGSSYGSKRRAGSVSNVSLRAVTPFEDAGENKTRSGRLVMKPLNYWEGETVVWKHGEVDGVVRASSVEPQKRVFKKKPAAKRKAAKRTHTLGAIDEADEELLPDEWEDEVGVLTGQVAEYDPDIGMGNDEYLETEDIAFAASAIITRSVQGASFNYAKIQTLPFFGSGIVEIPPGGFKATKNSRKMQMNFFMHKGKVQVTVTTPRQSDGSEPLSTTDFNITEGGAWIVPRGNQYTIKNNSTTTWAYLFFSQGCEVEEGDQTNGDAE